jgi:uncharacterized protein (DUF2147 family)
MGGTHSRLRTTVLLFLFAVTVAQLALADDIKESRILGNWLTEPRDGIIQISRGPGGNYEGRIVGGAYPGRRDEKNPDVNERAKVLRGQIILRGLHYDGDGKWSGGTIYEPDSGRTYKCSVELVAPDSLKVRGFIGIALLGRSQTWARYAAASMDLPAPR